MHPLTPNDVIGWTDDDLERVYVQAVAEAPPVACFVEIGAFLGRSTILMAKLIEASGKTITFSTVDTFQGSPDELVQMALRDNLQDGNLRLAFDLNTKRHGVQERIHVLQMPSVEAARFFPDSSLSFVFIDGDHRYEAVSADIQAWLPKVISGAVIAGHDAYCPGVGAAVKELLPGHEVRGTCWWYRVPGE